MFRRSRGPMGHIIYLHGRIIEEQGTRPTDPRFGVYEYQMILDTLAASGADVIAEHRRSGTDFVEFGHRVAGQVRDLIAAGVAPERIAVIGFSKGGGIAIIAAAQLGDTRVNFVFPGERQLAGGAKRCRHRRAGSLHLRRIR